MFKINSLNNDQRKQLIDTRMAFESWQELRAVGERRFGGSMRWKEQNGTEYLLRKFGKSELSLGARSQSTEEIFKQFTEGREDYQQKIAGVEAQIQRLAKVNQAFGLGRVPVITAKILRRLDDANMLGNHLHVVGTNALFAYEADAGVMLDRDLTTTADADLLMDGRRNLRLVLDDVRQEGVLGILKKIDQSFDLRAKGDYRAFNKDAFYVDLIRPETKMVMSSNERERLGTSDTDLHGSPIKGLNWLLNVPKRSSIAIDEQGYPVRIDTIDPRAFALHKMWVADRPDRDPIKKQRDIDQAKVTAEIAQSYLGLSFDASDLTALPAELREQAKAISPSEPEPTSDPDSSPSWY